MKPRYVDKVNGWAFGYNWGLTWSAAWNAYRQQRRFDGKRLGLRRGL